MYSVGSVFSAHFSVVAATGFGLLFLRCPRRAIIAIEFELGVGRVSMFM